MVIKVYISGISGNKEVKKRQQRVLLILDSKSIKYEVIDIAEPGAEEAKDFMQNSSTSSGGTISDPTPRHPLPPQIYNDDAYCGDYDQFDMANEIDEMETFLKLKASEPTEVVSKTEKTEENLSNGDATAGEKEVSNKTADSEAKENEQEPTKSEEKITKETKEESEADESKAVEDLKDADEAQEAEQKGEEDEKIEKKEESETKKDEGDSGENFWGPDES